MLVAGGRDFGNKFDGKLKYNKEKKKFALLFNTKYDVGMPEGGTTRGPGFRSATSWATTSSRPTTSTSGAAAPRTPPAASSSRRSRWSARPTHRVEIPPPDAPRPPILNKGELTLGRIERVATDFQASMLCTTIRAVRLSELPLRRSPAAATAASLGCSPRSR
jgi:hypothetical protein